MAWLSGRVTGQRVLESDQLVEVEASVQFLIDVVEDVWDTADLFHDL